MFGKLALAVVADRYVRRSLEAWLEDLTDSELISLASGVEAWRKRKVPHPLAPR